MKFFRRHKFEKDIQACGKNKNVTRRESSENGNGIGFDFFRGAVKFSDVVGRRRREFIIGRDKNQSVFLVISKTAFAFLRRKSGRNYGKKIIELFTCHNGQFRFHFRNGDNRFIAFSYEEM